MFEEMMQMVRELESVGDLCSWYYETDGSLTLEVEDFEGFDSDYAEISRQLVRPDLIRALEAFLEPYMTERGDDYYPDIYSIEGHEVEIRYSSWDI